MSQVKSERPESKFQILNDAKKVRNEIVSLVLRDFGIKNRKRNPKFYEHIYRMSEADGVVFEELLERYNLYNVLDEYPEWYITFLRKQLLSATFTLVNCIEYGNIYATSVHEWVIRRDYHNKALAQINIIYQLLDMAAATLPVDRNKFTQYFELLEKLIASIKSLRKSDNGKRKKQLEREQNELSSLVLSLTKSANKASTTLVYKLCDLLYRFGA